MSAAMGSSNAGDLHSAPFVPPSPAFSYHRLCTELAADEFDENADCRLVIEPL